jgi:hypothetical protein
MLDYFAIFTKGGALLWTLQFTALKHNPVEAINALIRTCLLEERSAESTYTYTPKIGAAQALKWTFHNVSCNCTALAIRICSAYVGCMFQVAISSTIAYLCLIYAKTAGVCSLTCTHACRAWD